MSSLGNGRRNVIECGASDSPHSRTHQPLCGQFRTTTSHVLSDSGDCVPFHHFRFERSFQCGWMSRDLAHKPINRHFAHAGHLHRATQRAELVTQAELRHQRAIHVQQLGDIGIAQTGCAHELGHTLVLGFLGCFRHNKGIVRMNRHNVNTFFRYLGGRALRRDFPWKFRNFGVTIRPACE